MKWVVYSKYDGGVTNRRIKIPAYKSIGGLGPFVNTMVLPSGLIGHLRTILAGNDAPRDIQNPSGLNLALAGYVLFRKNENTRLWVNVSPTPRTDDLEVVIVKPQLDFVEIEVE